VISNVLALRPHWRADVDRYVIGGIDMNSPWGMAMMIAVLNNVVVAVIFNLIASALIMLRLQNLKHSMSARTYSMHRMFLRILLLQVRENITGHFHNIHFR
jgi:hypothetical protein